MASVQRGDNRLEGRIHIQPVNPGAVSTAHCQEHESEVCTAVLPPCRRADGLSSGPTKRLLQAKAYFWIRP